MSEVLFNYFLSENIFCRIKETIKLTTAPIIAITTVNKTSLKLKLIAVDRKVPPTTPDLI
jgi:hypothetical protein